MSKNSQNDMNNLHQKLAKLVKATDMKNAKQREQLWAAIDLYMATCETLGVDPKPISGVMIC